jgi:hypothetical protein
MSAFTVFYSLRPTMRRLSRGDCRRDSPIALASVIPDPRFYRMSRKRDSCFDCFADAWLAPTPEHYLDAAISSLRRAT